MWNCMGKLKRFWIVSLLLALSAEVSQSRGHFELQLVSVDNARGELSSRDCCDGAERRVPDDPCAGECASYVRVCLKEYQTVVDITSACTYGTETTRVLGGNKFHFKSAKNGQNRNGDAGKITIPFQFSWLVSGSPDGFSHGLELLSGHCYVLVYLISFTGIRLATLERRAHIPGVARVSRPISSRGVRVAPASHPHSFHNCPHMTSKIC
ncbi:protein jagged-1b-like [Gadus morhua]|uniref:Protein jagged-1b-like n=1 Tax=Gadus morhua TaxID=8049 RepID=A0A8C4ZVK4_GADMO|nr:protein jagged-1b-like [Gadus morhua]